MKKIEYFTHQVVIATLVLFIALISGCQTSKTSLTFLGKDPYKVTVYEEMLNLEKVNTFDIQTAFDAYLSKNKLDEAQQRFIRKRIKNLNTNADHNGNFVSTEIKYGKLMEFRNPTQNLDYKESMIPAMNSTIIPKTIPNPIGKGAWKNLGPFGNPTVNWSATGRWSHGAYRITPYQSCYNVCLREKCWII